MLGNEKQSLPKTFIQRGGASVRHFWHHGNSKIIGNGSLWGRKDPTITPKLILCQEPALVWTVSWVNRRHCIPGKPTGTFQITGQYICLQPTWRLGQTYHLTWLLPPWLLHSVAVYFFQMSGMESFRKWKNNFSNWKHFLFYPRWVPKSEKTLKGLPKPLK